MANRYGIVNGQVVPLPPVDPSINAATAAPPIVFRLGSLTGDTPIEKNIALVQRVNRAMTADAAERAANRAKAVREVK